MVTGMPTLLHQVCWLFVILFAQFFSSTLQYVWSNISVMVNDELRATRTESTFMFLEWLRNAKQPFTSY